MTHNIIKNKTPLNRLKRGLFWKLLFFGLILFFISQNFGCANMQRPTGGPKDTIPPKILEMYPDNFSTNFTEEEIIITFDEFVKLNNQFSEFSISPDTETQPIYKVKKKDLHITLPDSLDENTTYSLNFGEGLVDFNEGNKLRNFVYVFSTGDELDSLTISGSVKDGFKKEFDYKDDEDVKILLIPTHQDSIFGKSKANIFTSVDTLGNFKFSNLREDTYRIYALKEEDNNRIYNGGDESIGFLKDSIVLSGDTSGIELEYTQGFSENFRVIDRKIDNKGFLSLVFNKPLINPEINILDDDYLNESKIVWFTAENDSSKIFLENFDFDSVRLEIIDENEPLDTIQLRKPRNLKLDRKIEPEFSISNKVDKVKHIRITSNFPIEDMDKSKVIITEDSVKVTRFSLQKDTLHKNSYWLRYNWKPKKEYELTIEEGAIVGAFETSNEDKKLNFTLDESDNYGDIHFKISGLDSEEQYIIEVTDEKKENVYDRKIVTGEEVNEISYLNFMGGKYTLRVLWDQNKNGRWDPGNVYTKKQAEPIWYFDKVFTVRANWEQNDEINVTFDSQNP